MSTLHESTFGFLKPNQAGVDKMAIVREAAKAYADVLDEHLEDGPDKTYALRKLREVAVWANISVTRFADGFPRPEYNDLTEEQQAEHTKRMLSGTRLV